MFISFIHAFIQVKDVDLLSFIQQTDVMCQQSVTRTQHVPSRSSQFCGGDKYIHTIYKRMCWA